MTLDFFLKTENLNDFKIDNVYVKDYELIIYANVLAHLDLIANGYRPELDFEVGSKFIFKTDICNQKFNKPFDISLKRTCDDGAIFTIGDKDIKVLNGEINITRYLPKDVDFN